ncbi:MULTISPECIES: RHS repeat-associated core domain-containing protein [Delftia]|uniref:RHS repeat-associated core domain-containing protein n=1 Tax=unclassified Delftia TaxID=2613839 RepID=UPI000A528569|nr:MULTISPECIES: RHS repeat-associated core domain-containing protein [Delftia]WON87000.1 RHS domain-containing protein [Delftia sp. UGAL515B_04]
MGTTLGAVGDNRLRFYQDLHFEYDVHGNVTKRTRGNQKAGTQEVLDLTWNADHQLIESNTTRHGVTQATRYTYDPLGRRVSKSDAFGSTHYLWDGDLTVHSQRGVRQALYIYEPGSFVPLATIQGAGEEHSTYWYQCDQIGAPLELTDEQGQVAWAADYKVWGEAVMRSVLRTGTDDRPISARAWGIKVTVPTPRRSVEQPLRLQGQQFDEETGLNYNLFRYYDPKIGRFISQDPIGVLGGSNLFEFALNPLTLKDPWGLKSIPHTDTNGGKGYDIYAICKEGGVVGYVGQTGDMDVRQGQHRDSGRLQTGEDLKRISNVPTYGDARGFEQKLIEHHDTLDGKWGCPCGKGNIGNKKVGYNRDSTTRPADRHSAFEKGYQKAEEWLKNAPSSQINPC